MGMGKTRISLEWIKLLSGSVLVVAPLRGVLTTWPDQINEWTPELTYRVLRGNGKHLDRPAKVYIINYDGLQWLLKELKDRFKRGIPLPFRAMVIDEGQLVKSHKTKRFKVLKVLRDICSEGIIILSGTPATNSLLDLWSQYYLLDAGKRLGTAITKYRDDNFKSVDKDRFVWKIKSKQHADGIHKLVSDITFRLDAKDYLELPDRIDNIISVELPVSIQKKIKQLEDTFLITLSKSTIAARTKVAASMKLRQVIQGGIYTDELRNFEVLHTAKLDILKSLVEEANGQSILCAIQFKFELAMLHEVFPKAPIVAGGSNINDFIDIVRRWNNGDIPIMFCHPGALSTSVNLQAGSHLLVWYGLPWSLEQYLQLNARIFRQGQKQTVIFHHLIAKGTIDERVYKALQLKLASQDALLNYLKETSYGFKGRDEKP
jgi:SNF2 family DNA or RNA helicase